MRCESRGESRKKNRTGCITHQKGPAQFWGDPRPHPCHSSRKRSCWPRDFPRTSTHRVVHIIDRHHRTSLHGLSTKVQKTLFLFAVLCAHVAMSRVVVVCNSNRLPSTTHDMCAKHDMWTHDHDANMRQGGAVVCFVPPPCLRLSSSAVCRTEADRSPFSLSRTLPSLLLLAHSSTYAATNSRRIQMEDVSSLKFAARVTVVLLAARSIQSIRMQQGSQTGSTVVVHHAACSQVGIGVDTSGSFTVDGAITN